MIPKFEIDPEKIESIVKSYPGGGVYLPLLESMRLFGEMEIKVVTTRLEYEFPEEFEKFRKLDTQGQRKYISSGQAEPLDVFIDNKAIILVRDEMRPMFAKAITPELFLDLGKEYWPIVAIQMSNFLEYYFAVYKSVFEVRKFSEREESSLYLPAYLMLSEGVYESVIDLVIYCAILSGIEYYRIDEDGKENIKKIDSMKRIQLEKINDKIKFLEDNGFSILTDSFDKFLRNSIAHADFVINDDGSINYRRNREAIKITADDLGKKIFSLRETIQGIDLAFFEAAQSILFHALLKMSEKEENALKRQK